MISLCVKICLVAVFLRLCDAFNLFNRRDISLKTGASCLDGSQFGYYLWQPDQYEPKSNNLLIHFQETPFGWCIKEDLSKTLEECYKFMTADNLIDFGSSQNWAGSQMFLNGILSPFDSGQFNSWTKVFVKSCDGGLFMGDINPVEYRKHKIHFKGSVNIVQMFKSLQKTGYLNVQEIVISGSMNGAIAALMWSQNLKDYSDANVRVIADSAIHLNQYNRKTQEYVFENRMRIFSKLALNNGQLIPNQKCVQNNSEDPWKCLTGIELSKYVDYPIFYTQSLYDGWSIGFILGYTCAEDFGSLSQCPQQERQVIIKYHENVTKLIKEMSEKVQEKNNGIFSIACVTHEFLGARWNNEIFQIPMNSGNMAVKVVSEWIKKKTSSVFIDKVDWPENKPCANKLTSLQRQ